MLMIGIKFFFKNPTFSSNLELLSCFSYSGETLVSDWSLTFYPCHLSSAPRVLSFPKHALLRKCRSRKMPFEISLSLPVRCLRRECSGKEGSQVAIFLWRCYVVRLRVVGVDVKFEICATETLLNLFSEKSLLSFFVPLLSREAERRVVSRECCG